MSIRDIQAVDVHAHYGRYRWDVHELLQSWMSGDVETVLARAKAANIEYTVVSPLTALSPRGGADPVAGNEEAADLVARHEGLRQWAVLSPLHPETFEQVDRMLAGPRCIGIKLHPEEHVYPIHRHGERLFEFAAARRAVVLAHSGDPHSPPMDYVPWADAFPEVKLILAHLGHAHDGDPSQQVRAIQACKHGNIYVDTSSKSSIWPTMIEWAAGRIGSDRILFGTDTPLYLSAMQRARIDRAELCDGDKRRILRENAESLLALRS